jgi:hypothetical protein
MVQVQIQTGQQNPRGQIVFLGALPLNALPRRIMNLSITPITLRNLSEWVSRKIAEGCRAVHYICHPSTISALRALGIPLDDRPNADPYRYQEGDVLVVVSLRNPPRGQDAAEVSPEDLEAWIVYIS